MRTITITAPGPQGIQGVQGPAGVQGDSVFSSLPSGVWSTTASIQISGSFTVSGSSTFTNIGPAIFSGSTSLVGATTMSSALVSGNVTVLGTASINVLQINTTINSTGSNTLGDNANDTQTLFGSVVIPTGSLTVTGSAIINTLTVGLGGGQQSTNTAIGVNALSQNTTGTANTAVGYLALASNNTTGTSNSAFGYLTMRFSTGGSNCAFGTTALYGITVGSNNSAFGRDAGYYIADGVTAATSLGSSVFIGANTKALADGQSNQIVIGQNAIGLGNNSAVLGNNSITRTALKGDISIGTTGSISSRLHVQGSGATSATTALRVENTNASASLVVLDNGFVGINTGSAQYNLDVNGTTRVQNHLFINSGFAIASLGNNVNLRSDLIGGSGYVVNAQSYNTLNSSGNEQGFGLFTGTYAPTSVSGTPSFNALKLTPTINQTGGTNGITRGLYINPTLTAAADFRAIETTAGRVVISDTVTVTGTNATSLLDLSQTWNTTGAPIALKVNITDTASASTSDLISLQVGGSVRFRVVKSGFFSFNTGGDILGNLCVGGSTINVSCQLEVRSTTKGFLPPRMTTTQKNAIASPAAGLVVYDTTLGKLCVRGAAAWETITSI